MSERVICKDSTKKRVDQTLVKIIGWSGVRCYSYERHEDYIEAGLQSTHHAAKCPYCGRRSSHLHSRYERTVDDLPVHGLRVILRVEVSRYRCMNPKCSHRTFVEQCAGVTEKYQRRTVDQRRQLQEILGLVASTVGSRQCASMGIDISSSTALRIVRRIHCEIDYNSYRHLCIDDFATRKGREYRTLIIDADTHLPLEIVPSRDKADVAKALRKYKHATIISRDRSSAYAGAIKLACPKAKQIADKFHLVKNCGEHLDKQLRVSMPDVMSELSATLDRPVESGVRQEAMYKPPASRDIDLFAEIHKLKDAGLSNESIGKDMRISAKTVAKYLSMDRPRGRKITESKCVGRYIDIIQEGITSGLGYKAIREKIIAAGGYVDYGALCDGMKKVFPEYHPKQGYGGKTTSPLSVAQKERAQTRQLLGSNMMKIYVTNPSFGVKKDTGECTKERERADMLICKSGILQDLRQAYTSFRDVMSGGKPDELNAWIEKYSGAQYQHIASFAKELNKDITAIKNAIRYSISNGPMEGCNNKVKAVKRSMYGRAKDDLLLIKITLYSRKHMHVN